MKQFVAKTVDLSGFNLIEASAGTGKTYSIAILVLRLILEKKVPINRVLMVTFTNAAVGELQIRIRKFLNLAYASSKGLPCPDSTIEELVAIAISSATAVEIEQLLFDNIALLDESKIMTINGFCQNVLKEHAFESNQILGAVLDNNDDKLIKQYVNQFWRDCISVLPVEVLKFINVSDLKLIIQSLSNSMLSGIQVYPLPNVYHTWQDLLSDFSDIMQDPTCMAEASSYSERKKAPPKKKKKGEPEAMETFSIAPDKAVILEKAFTLRKYIIYFACNYATNGVRNYKKNKGIISFNDQINQVYQAIEQDSEGILKSRISEKYDVVFIDEFQDTDQKQYFIFKTLFYTDHHTTFMIGDPKQSIYSFRQADIYTYFKARNDAGENVYTMNTNYRSSPEIIDSLNALFLPTLDFDTFYFEDSSSKIEYHPVESGKSAADRLWVNGAPSTGITIRQIDKAEDLLSKLAYDISSLIQHPNHYFIDSSGEKRAIRPSDIGVLVATNKKGIAIQKALSKMGIPSVIINESTIFNSKAASGLLALLTACLNPTKSTINLFLLSSIVGFSPSEIESLDEIFLLQLFDKWKNVWELEGLFSMINQLFTDLDYTKRIQQDKSNDTIRNYVDLIQIVEILHKMQLYKKLSQEEIVYQLNQGINGALPKDDAYNIRIESDAAAVQITTIHKSKGLEYPIVFLPDVDKPSNKDYLFSTFSVYDYEKSSYFSITKEDLEGYKINLEIERERDLRRLLYVAFTRAKYKIYTYSKNAFAKAPSKGGGLFLKQLYDRTALENVLFDFTELEGHEEKHRISTKSTFAPFRKVTHFTITDTNWDRLSYSKISVHPQSENRVVLDIEHAGYDAFIFNKIGKGAHLGTRLHTLFEKVDFTKPYKWSNVIDKVFFLLTSLKKINHEEEAIKNELLVLLDHITNVTIDIDNTAINLFKVANEHKMNELEFHFPLAAAQMHELKKWMSQKELGWVKHWDAATIQGFMYGLVDLLFEYEGKYYILDWKSNFLGNTIADYAPENIATAMLENNYHLQYLIYTIAVTKYLQSRIPDFDYAKHFGGVIYMFVRGVRKEGIAKNNGIFTYKPPIKDIIQLEKIMS